MLSKIISSSLLVGAMALSFTHVSDCPVVEVVTVYETVYVEVPSEPYIIDIGLSADLQRYTYKMCKKYDCIDNYTLVLAVMKKESNFDAGLISRTNDYGLMQININNHDWLISSLGITDFLDPEQSIECGVLMLSQLITTYVDTNKVLMAYNYGEGGAARRWKSAIYTSPYSVDVVQEQNYINNLIYRDI